MCAFDCAQVLAEWVATLQDRVGGYLGILGHDKVDYTNMPAIMLLEEEDVKLLQKIEQLLSSMEIRMNMETAGDGGSTGGDVSLTMDGHNGFATKLLRATAYSLDKAAIWPVTRLTARCLETQANYTKARAEKSTTNGP
jgi:hypothetical protein